MALVNHQNKFSFSSDLTQLMMWLQSESTLTTDFITFMTLFFPYGHFHLSYIKLTWSDTYCWKLVLHVKLIEYLFYVINVHLVSAWRGKSMWSWLLLFFEFSWFWRHCGFIHTRDTVKTLNYFFCLLSSEALTDCWLEQGVWGREQKRHKVLGFLVFVFLGFALVLLFADLLTFCLFLVTNFTSRFLV